MPTIPEILRGLPPARREALLRLMPAHEVIAGNRYFPEWAHGGQVAPGPLADGSPWRTWVLMAGRGFGKTRAGAEWVLSMVRGGAGPREVPAFGGARASKSPSPSGEGLGVGAVKAARHIPHPNPSPKGEGLSDLRIALVAATVDEARRVMVEGASGLLACARPGEIREWAPSRRELVFANGTVATLFSGANPEALRGPQHHLAWCDELAKWRHPEATWDMLQFGLRCGAYPRALVTTTPKGGCATLKRILAHPATTQTGGSTRQNPHLPEAFVASVESTYGGTRMGREEIDGVFLPDVAGSLWPAELIERCRVSPLSQPSPLKGRGLYERVVIGVDPPASAEGTCGIVVCGLGADGVGHVLADWTRTGLSPEGWARRVASAAEAHGADRLVVEKNQGGDMVSSVLRAAGVSLPITPATATKSKPARAEPVAGLFEAGRAKFAGRFAELEEELAGLVPAGYVGPGKSPDRADAMVWALWALLIAPAAEPRVRGL